MLKVFYIIVPAAIFLLIYLGKVDVDIEFLGNVIKIISK